MCLLGVLVILAFSLDLDSSPFLTMDPYDIILYS